LPLTLHRETPPGELPSYEVREAGDRVGRVFREEENGSWMTEPDVGSYESREAAVHAVATGRTD